MRCIQRRRQGTSLLEILVYISLTAVLVAMTAQWFHAVFQVASRSKIQQRQHAALKRLVSDFRRDVVSSTDVLVESPQLLVLTNVSNQQIVYRIDEGRVASVVGDSKQPTRQEVYPDLGNLRLEFVAAQSDVLPQWVSLNVFRSSHRMKFEQSKRPPAKFSAFEKRLLQVRCGPRSNGLEAGQ